MPIDRAPTNAWYVPCGSVFWTSHRRTSMMSIQEQYFYHLPANRYLAGVLWRGLSSSLPFGSVLSCMLQRVYAWPPFGWAAAATALNTQFSLRPWVDRSRFQESNLCVPYHLQRNARSPTYSPHALRPIIGAFASDACLQDVRVEAEQTALVSGWAHGTSISGYSGSSFVA
jgi:hypothetical protein